MQKTRILIVCSHAEILSTIVRLVDKNPQWQATGCADINDAFAAFTDEPFPLVLIGSGIDASDECLLEEKLRALSPDVRIVKHYGGGSGLLSAEIIGALS